MYNFDEMIQREGTNSAKWSENTLEKMFGERKMLPFWVADMDFEVAPAIKAAVVKRAEHGIYGYSEGTSQTDAFISWLNRRFGWQAKSEWILNTPGVVTAFNLAVQTYCKPGDNVIIQRPVYYPFSNAVLNNGCHILANELIIKDGQYQIDFADFEEKAKDPNTTMFILCSPHNPVGRVWTVEELTRLADICLEHHVLIVADEIHNDLIMPGHKHHVLANLDEKYAQHTITCLAPSKTFNLAGMQFSSIVIPNEELRRKFARSLDQTSLGMPNPFAIAAVTAAYNDGEAWLEELLVYLQKNVDFVKEYLGEQLPKVKFFDHQATYLLWMDFRAFDLTDEKLHDVVYHKAKVAMDGGSWFGPEGEGFMRLNLACPKALLKEGLDAIVKAFHDEGLS